MDDRLDANSVEIVVDQTGKVWVNIDGKCALRVGHAKIVTIDDPLRGFDTVHGDDTE